MPKLAIKRGTTSKIVRLFIQDSSQSDGRGLAGLTNASGGLVAYQIREGQASPTAITLAAGTVGTWSSGGFKEVDGTNLPGVYELGVPDVALSTGNSTLVMLKGAAGMVPVVLEIELDAYDPQDAVRLGLTALPNAAAGANGGLPTGDASGRVTVVSNADKTGYALAVTPPTAAAISTAVWGETTRSLTDKLGFALSGAGVQAIWDALMSALTSVGSVGKLLADNLNATVGSRLATAGYTAPDNATIATRASQASVDTVAGYVDTEVAAILAAVDTEVAAIKAKTDALPAAPANEATLTTIAGYVDTEVAAIKAKTDNLPAAPANETTLQATLATLAGYVDTEVGAIKAKTDNLPAAPAAVGSAMTLDLTQAIPSSTTTATIGRALLGMEAQALGRWTIVGTTLTLYRQDGTTVVRAFTLDSGSAPTSRT